MDRPLHPLSRRIAAAALIGLAIVVGVGGAYLAIRGDGSSSGLRSALLTDSGEYRGSEPPGGIAMGDFALRNFDGRLVRSSDLRDRVIVLTFLDSQCTEACPVIAWTVARTVDGLTPAEKKVVQAVAISTDPGEDSSASVRGFLARNRALGRMLYVGGGQPERELRRVWDAFHVLSSLESGHDTLHSAPVRIYDRGGHWASTLHARADLTVASLAHDIRVALSAATDGD
jgi:protein SCO1/2